VHKKSTSARSFGTKIRYTYKNIYGNTFICTKPLERPLAIDIYFFNPRIKIEPITAAICTAFYVKGNS
jgi:hypothetical protein